MVDKVRGGGHSMLKLKSKKHADEAERHPGLIKIRIRKEEKSSYSFSNTHKAKSKAKENSARLADRYR